MDDIDPKQTSKAAQTRGRILDTAERLILAKSFSAVGINQVLSACDVPKGSFYHYFKSKEDFGVHLIQRHAAIYGRELDRLLDNGAPTARQRLVQFFRFHVGYYQDNGCTLDCLVVKLSSEVSTLGEPLRHALLQATTDWSGKFAAVVQEGQADGSVNRDLDPRATGAFLFSYWLGANTQIAISRSVTPFEAADAMIDRHLR